MISIFQNNLRRTLRSGVRLVILLVLPLMFMNLFIPKSYDVPIQVAFIDEDQTALTSFLRDRLAAQFSLVDVAEPDVLSALLDDRVQYALIAHAGFTTDLVNGQTPVLDARSLDGFNAALAVEQYVESLMNAIGPIAHAAGGNQDAFSAAIESFASGSVGTKLVQTEEASTARTMGVLGFLVQFMLYMSVVTTGLILEERSNRSLCRIFTAPVTAKQYMGGHLLSSVLIGFTQVAVVFLVLRYLMDVYFGTAFVSVIVLFALFAVVCICLGLLITAYFRNPKQAYVFVLFISTPLVMLGGCYWPRSYLPDVLVRIGNLIPTTWVMEGARKLVEGGSLTSIIGEMAILAAFAAVFFAGGVLRKVDVAN